MDGLTTMRSINYAYIDEAVTCLYDKRLFRHLSHFFILIAASLHEIMHNHRQWKGCVYEA